LSRRIGIRETAIDLRRSLRPVAWVVLEELALCAVEVEDGVVAAASARTIAARLGLDPATAASALRTLRERGLVEFTRASGLSGRFGLSVYRLVQLPGLEVQAPRGDPPHTTTPRAGNSDATTPSPRRTRRPVHVLNGHAQGTFDLGSGRR
jgi:hypothetical protein